MMNKIIVKTTLPNIAPFLPKSLLADILLFVYELMLLRTRCKNTYICQNY